MKYLKRVLCACLAAAMMLSLTSCSDTTWVVKSDKGTVTSGMYIAYQILSYMNLYSHEDFNSEEADMMKQVFEDKKAPDFINEKALEEAMNYVAIEKKFDELKLEFTDEDEASAKQELNFIMSYYGTLFENNAVSEESYKKITINNVKKDKIFTHYYGEKGLEEVDQAVLKKYLKDNYLDVNYLQMSHTAEDESSSEQFVDSVKAQAKDFIERINSGKATLNEVSAEYENQFITEESEKITEIKKDKETKSLIKKDSTSPSEKFISLLFSSNIANDKAFIIEDEDNTYVAIKYDIDSDTANFEDNKKSILYEIKQDEFNELISTWTNEIKDSTQTNQSSVNRYKPQNIKTDME